MLDTLTAQVEVQLPGREVAGATGAQPRDRLPQAQVEQPQPVVARLKREQPPAVAAAAVRALLRASTKLLNSSNAALLLVESSEHESDGGKVDHPFTHARVLLIILAQPPIPIEPAERALDNPPLW